ncbi:MAG TPA: hypothetical protein VH105_00665 [Burkholderiales bacterium]|jgi:hypothetical protein|nr:hypothetical protein [Burkholderiales bacterium]
MLEQLKTLMSHQVRGQLAEFVYSLTPEIRSAILLDLRYVLRDTTRARSLPLLLMLVQTVERNNSRIRFPAEVLARLAREIEGIRDKLPVKSPLLALADGAREHLGASALETNSIAPSMPAVTPAAAPAAPSAVARAGTRMPPASAAAAPAATTEAPPGGGPTSLFSPEDNPVDLKRAAARTQVDFVTTVALDDVALAGYLNYCMTLGDYPKIIETLLARVEEQPRVWAWNMLVTAMRMSGHRDFSFTAARYHVWLAATHPETIADSTDEDQRKFSSEKIAALERAELGEG